ncbi:MAG: VOC family protein [Brevirhabdus sp.]
MKIPTPTVSALDHLVLTVMDLDQTVEFYTCLGMTHAAFTGADGTRRHALSFGRQKINLHVAGAEFEPKARRATPGSADLCFLSDTPLADWVASLEDAGIEVEQGPVPRTGATGPLVSIYLRDPDGNLIEISNRA